MNKSSGLHKSSFYRFKILNNLCFLARPVKNLPTIPEIFISKDFNTLLDLLTLFLNFGIIGIWIALIIANQKRFNPIKTDRPAVRCLGPESQPTKDL